MKKGPKIRVKKGRADLTLPDGGASARVHGTFGVYLTKTEVSLRGRPTVTRRRLNWWWPIHLLWQGWANE
jgi:hypothetical protein